MTPALGVEVLICRRSVAQVKQLLCISATASRKKALPVESEVTLRVKVKVTQGQKSILYSNFRVFKGELNAHDRMTLKVKVKVIQGQISVSGSNTRKNTLWSKPTLNYVRYFPTPITQSVEE